MSERLTDDQVAWYAGTSRTAKWTADMAVHENIVTLAREVQAHRSSCECAPMAEYPHEMWCPSMSEPAVTSFHLDTSAGGIPITLCACGLLIFQPMARIHLATCAIYIAHQAVREPCGYSLGHRNRHQCDCVCVRPAGRSEEHTSELQSPT